MKRFLDDTLIEKWKDGSIPRKAKGELFQKFNRQFGYTSTSNTFSELMRKKAQPTPNQHAFLEKHVNQCWDFYNPEPQPVEQA